MLINKAGTPVQRIMIIGGAGSGKSTLARALGERISIPVFHMDHIHWKPGWTERTQPQKIKLVSRIHAQEKWILEGNHSATFEARINRAQLLVWLDLPFLLCQYRVLRRAIHFRGQTRPDLPADCPERLDREMLSFLAYNWRARHSSRTKILRISEQPPPHLKIVQLRSAGEVHAFLQNIYAAAPATKQDDMTRSG